MQGQEEADESRADEDCFSDCQCCLSISETLLKHCVVSHTELGLVTLSLLCCVQFEVLLNSDHWVNSYFLSKSYTCISSLCSLCSKATLIIKMTSRDDPRKILR